MRSWLYLTICLITVAMFPAGNALANMCRTDHLLCPTAMPVDGYCECTAHGTTEGGDAVVTPPPGRHLNAATGGCGAEPASPNCH